MKKLIFLTIALGICSALFAQATPPPSSQQVRPAYTIRKGNLYAQTQVRFFFQDQILELAPNLLTGETYWDIQNSISLIYGLRDHVELQLQQIVYQDNHKPGTGYNLPDDLFLSARFANFGDPARQFLFGGALEVRLPLAEYHNLPLEPYSAGRPGFGLTFLASHLSDPDLPGTGTTLSANIGFFLHNDHGLILTSTADDTISAAHNSSEFLYGLAASQSLGRFVLQAEFYGRAFMRKPEITAYTRENSLYFSPAINYTLPSTIQFRLCGDFRLSGETDDTYYLHAKADALPWKSLPNVPKWRVNVGLTVPLIPFALLQSRKKNGTIETSFTQQQLEQELTRQLAAERKKAEEAEENLARIRAERERIGDILQRLRNTVENRGDKTAESTEPQVAPAEPPPAQTPAP
jgi:hypothetical protein